MTRRRGLRPADDLLAPSVAEALRALALDVEQLDRGARALALQYAEAIDSAALVADLATEALARTGPDDGYVSKALETCLAELEHRRVLEKLGPKLLDALSAVGATYAARAKATKAAPSSDRTAPTSRLEALRGDHAG